MSGPVALAGWALAFAALALGAGVARELSRRMELVARACHELRGPLTAARLGLHLLTRRDEATQPRLSAIDLELRRAGLALDDLHAAQLGRRARDREEGVDVGALLDEAATAWRPVALAAGTELRVDWPGGAAVVRGDRLRLAQACGNLVANAIEHGHGPVELRGRATGESVRIEVIDCGPGLPAPVAELARLARAGRGRRGRGLAITAEIAARHGGRLAAAPSAQGGRVALELPLSGASRAARA
jgi:signal transduction histidine kinase